MSTNIRTTNSPKLDRMFIERWSPRSFLQDSISEDDIQTMFEAARWSPSGYNEQPWRFVYAQQSGDLEQFRSALMEANQSWANDAPLLIFVFSKKHFTQNEKPNPWAEFDTGAATMALSLQANKLGLHTHVMGGIYADKAFEVTGMESDKYDVVCAIAVGKIGDMSDVETSSGSQESRSPRKKLSEFVFEGRN